MDVCKNMYTLRVHVYSFWSANQEAITENWSLAGILSDAITRRVGSFQNGNSLYLFLRLSPFLFSRMPFSSFNVAIIKAGICPRFLPVYNKYS